MQRKLLVRRELVTAKLLNTVLNDFDATKCTNFGRVLVATELAAGVNSGEFRISQRDVNPKGGGTNLLFGHIFLKTA